MSDAQDWDHWLDTILEKGVNLSSWETDFIESLEARRAGFLDRRLVGLTEKQAEILERIYSARTP